MPGTFAWRLCLNICLPRNDGALHHLCRCPEMHWTQRSLRHNVTSSHRRCTKLNLSLNNAAHCRVAWTVITFFWAAFSFPFVETQLVWLPNEPAIASVFWRSVPCIAWCSALSLMKSMPSLVNRREDQPFITALSSQFRYGFSSFSSLWQYRSMVDSSLRLGACYAERWLVRRLCGVPVRGCSSRDCREYWQILWAEIFKGLGVKRVL